MTDFDAMRAAVCLAHDRWTAACGSDKKTEIAARRADLDAANDLLVAAMGTAPALSGRWGARAQSAGRVSAHV
jgi:hypothetical protein